MPMVSPQSAQIASSLPVTGMTTQQLENIQKTARKGSLGKMRFNQNFSLVETELQSTNGGDSPLIIPGTRYLLAASYEGSANNILHGSDKDIKVNVRVVAATNKNLKKEIANSNFREDLYHRLAVILIEVPSLNDRREDIPLLIEYFSKKIANEQGSIKKSFSSSAIKLLQAYDWTGNIRELRNVVERLIILGEPEISESDVKLFASKKI